MDQFYINLTPKDTILTQINIHGIMYSDCNTSKIIETENN